MHMADEFRNRVVEQMSVDIYLPSNLWYKAHQISQLKCSLFLLAVVFSQSIEARCWAHHEDVVGAAPTGDASTTSEWSKILFSTEVRLIIEIWR